MLKLSYTDDGLFLEQTMASLDAVTNQRVMLTIRIGETLHLAPSWATVLLSAEMSGDITRLKPMLETDLEDTIDLTPADEDFVEVSLKGIWIAKDASTESGTFVTTLTPESERLIYQLWQVTQRQTACLR